MGQAEIWEKRMGPFSDRTCKAFFLCKIRNKNLGRPFPEDTGKVGHLVGSSESRLGGGVAGRSVGPQWRCNAGLRRPSAG